MAASTPTKLSCHESHHLQVTGLRPSQPSVVHITNKQIGVFMLTIQNYKKVESLEEAYELNQKKANRIVGGMMWMRMGDN